MTDGGRGSARELEVDGTRWRALEAWRGEGGHGLCYFLALEGGAPAPDDRLDRRACLEPGRDLSAMSEGELAELLAGAVPLTGTERRFTDASGDVWLAQNSGPVWAEGEAAAGLTGIVFTRLAGGLVRVAGPDGHLRDADEATLRRGLERLLGSGDGG